MEKRSAHITFLKRLWWRRSCNSSGKLNKYKTLDSRDFVPFNAFTELSIGNIKKPCECFYSMPENSCDVLASDRGPSVPGQNNSKKKSFIWSGFLRISNRTVKENVIKEIRLRVRHLLKSIRDQPNMQPLYRSQTNFELGIQ